MAELREVVTGMGTKVSPVEKKKTEAEYVLEYVKAVTKIDEEVKVYREHKRDLKKDFVDNSKLTKEKIKIIDTFLRLRKNKIDSEKLAEVEEKILGVNSASDPSSSETN